METTLSFAVFPAVASVIFRNEEGIGRITNVIEDFNASWLNSVPAH